MAARQRRPPPVSYTHLDVYKRQVLGLGGEAYSLRTGLPIVMAWSTPGAALLVLSLIHI